MATPDDGPAALYLIATPIGNLEDFSPRGRRLLQEVPHLFAEDTRHSRRLLEHCGIHRPLQSCHEHNEEKVAGVITAYLQAGQSCALLSDAGTPAISDPGFRVVRACRGAGLRVVPVPGPNAAIAALCASGLPTDRFHFFGFLPPKRSARQRCLQEQASAPDTLIFQESTHRIDKFLHDVQTILGPQRCICLARELTKRHETVFTGPVHAVREQFASTSHKGEFMLLIAKEGFQLT